ncbi:hypothetical protein GWO43_09380 [candidate division KSB1 bacterium]|nr:hypothetical protein [candidate division KSB1 bacterium]NIR69360.1 hypothetical protein [candidate division KSB1 bacterium]NIS24178.1 hypothetical protein [candidate division KSB1 bacterium]NIT71093.1 hypothetical protein [candidate division KSB1 bacterium]NIU24797.1 hypothetical protein [candidate division KSB1 bacterium]
MKRVFLYSVIAASYFLTAGSIYWMFYFLYFQKAGNGDVWDAMFNAAMFVTFGSLHSLLARDFTKKYLEKWLGENFVRSVYVLLSGMTLMLLLHLWRPLSGFLWKASGPFYWILAILYFGSIISIIYTGSFISYQYFLGIRTLVGILKRQPTSPPEFSVKGPYSYCRHPINLLLLISFWLGPVMTYSRLEFATLGSIYLLIGTALEERNLRQEFGEVYEVYRAHIPMWIPRFRPRRYNPLLRGAEAEKISTSMTRT